MTVPAVLFLCIHNAGRSQMALQRHLPFVPGKRYEDWKLDDPAGQGIEAVRLVRDEIEHRVRELLAGLIGPQS